MLQSLVRNGMDPADAKRLIIQLDEAASRAPNLPNPNQAGNTRAAPGFRPTGRRPKGGGLDPDSLASRRRGRGNR